MDPATPTNDGIPAIEDLHPGTRVICAGQWHGVVVFNSITAEYSDECPASVWQGHRPGFMVRYTEVGLVFQEEPDEDLTIVR